MDQVDEDVADPSAERTELSLEEQESVTVQAELSSVLEESVESLSAAVGGWRGELARSSERSSRLEATIASLSAAMETWKTDMARTGARAEERLLRALEILESRMTQNQAIANEIRESLGSSASWLTRAMEEWKAEIRYGSGLTEVRLLSAIENLEGRFGQDQETESQSRERLENRSAEMARNLEARLETVKAVQDETREWLEAAATAMGNDAQSALGRLRELGSSIDAFRGEMRQNAADDRALASESHALQVGRINEVVRSVSEAQSASAADRADIRAEVNSLKESVVEAVATGLSDIRSANSAALSGMGKEVGSVKEAVTQAIATGLAEAQGANTAVLSEIRSGMGSMKDSVTQAVAAGLAEAQSGSAKVREEVEQAISLLKGTLEEWKSTLDASTTQTETRLVRALEALEEGIVGTRTLGSEIQNQLKESMSALSTSLSETHALLDITSGHSGEMIARGLSELEGKILSSIETKILNTLEDRLSLLIAAGSESRGSLENLISNLTGTVHDWRGDVGKAATSTETKLVRSLEALESGIAESTTGRQEIESQLLARLEELETRLSRTEQERQESIETSVAGLAETVQERVDSSVAGLAQSIQERVESSVAELAQSIDEWRNKGRESAGRTRDRISQSLEALENKILEVKEEEADYRDLVHRELVALTDAVENLGAGRDSSTLLRGMEELDEGLLRNRDDLANLAETFEAQFEIFESRVGDAIAARIDALERNIQERNKALVTLILGPKADSETLASLEPTTPRRNPSASTAELSEPRSGQQARRRR